MSDVEALTVPAAGWYPDRNEANTVRWWDGQQWTDHTQSTAPAVAAFEQPVSSAAFGFVPPVQNPLAQVTHQVAPGWYPDNADPSLQRWWDGRDWTAHTAPTVSAMQPSPGYVGAAKNTLATLAMVLAIGSLAGLLLAPLLLLAIPGIVVGIVALTRVRRYAPGAGRRGQAIAGIVVSAVSVILTILLTVAAVGVYQQVHQGDVGQKAAQQVDPGSGTGSGASGITFPSTVAELKQAIVASVEAQDPAKVTTVTCDDAASMVAGSKFQCGVIVDDGRWNSISVQIGHSNGSGMSFGLSYGPLMSADAKATPVAYSVDQIKQDLTRNLQQAWDSSPSITCADSASTTQGSGFRCDVVLADGRVGAVWINMVDPGGYDVSVTDLPTDSGDSTNPDTSHA